MKRKIDLFITLISILLFSSTFCFASDQSIESCTNSESYKRNVSKCQLAMENLLDVLSERTSVKIYSVDSYAEFMAAINVISILKDRPLLVENIPGVSDVSIQMVKSGSGFHGTSMGILSVFISGTDSIYDIKRFMETHLYGLAEVSDEEWFDMMADIMDNVETQRLKLSSDEDADEVFPNILR